MSPNHDQGIADLGKINQLHRAQEGELMDVLFKPVNEFL